MAFALIPIAAIGHVAGLKAHQAITQNDLLFSVGSVRVWWW
jgi:hypothetical protein